MTDSYLLLWPIVVALGAIGGVWLHSKLDPGVRPSRVPIEPISSDYHVAPIARRR